MTLRPQDILILATVNVIVTASVIASIHKSDGCQVLECVEVGRGETWSQIPRQITDACVLTFLEQMQPVLREKLG